MSEYRAGLGRRPSKALLRALAQLPSSDCVIWPAKYRDRDGYAAVRFNGPTVQAHRAVYSVVVGPIPDGLQLDHVCRVRDCVNPAHLEPVTPAENTHRALEIVRAFDPRTHCHQGHELTPQNVLYDRCRGRRVRRCRTCVASYTARRYGQAVS